MGQWARQGAARGYGQACGYGVMGPGDLCLGGGGLVDGGGGQVGAHVVCVVRGGEGLGAGGLMAFWCVVWPL